MVDLPVIDLSIVIVSWNTKDLLDQCLASVFADRTGGTMEVWVVDNASSDGSAEMVEERYPQVKLIRNVSNPGFAGANNQAIRQACGKYILLLNPDTKITPGALNTLLRFMDSSPLTGAAGARLLNPDGSLQVSCFPTPTLFREFWRLFHLDVLRPTAVYRMESWSTSQPRAVDILLGACLLLKRETLDQVGLLDEDYFMYSEEVDLCHRVKNGGWQLHWVPEAEVVHYGGQSTKQTSEKMFFHLYLSKIQFFRKNQGQFSAQVYKLVILLAATVRLLLVPLTLLESGNQRKQHMSLSNLYRRLLFALPQM